MQTRLTKADLNAIEARVQAESGDLGPEPTIETLRAEGHTESRALNAVLDTITATGRIATLIIAETIQAGAALLIGVVFAVLEYWRVYHGAEALGQPGDQAALIAVAVVVANVVHPIYSLRNLRGKESLMLYRGTARGYLAAFRRRLFGQPTTEDVDLYHNPTLHVAAAVITWTTVILAVYDILGPLLTQLVTNSLDRPLLLAIMELVMGLGLSIAGVFFLQSAAHEIGVRTLTDQPPRLADELATRKAEHHAQVIALRARITAEHQAAKLADQDRMEKEKNNYLSTDPLANHAEHPGHAVNGSANGADTR